ncbi:hypothetical protein L6452_35928 [Arctium lappa]|uniref:Uncharacterized protein n=1 Tax=Arctium lappa TaxID=4217 RepID=A0ACB8Y8Y1_ARCLA|nr:hypothetical protein L6452_35928 [Arctium lappa]
MKVTTEEKRIHDWAITTMGGEFEIVFELDNGASLMRGNLENLAKPSAVFPHVVDGWAELLTMKSNTLTMKSNTGAGIQFDVISSQRKLWNLAISACFNMEVLKMRNMDLVVFNFKNPSIVVIDNRYWEGCDMDDAIGNYEHVVDILVIETTRTLDISLHGLFLAKPE